MLCVAFGSGVATLPWNQWQLCRGMIGSFAMESVATLPWNRWQLSPGISGNFGVESVATFARNTQTPKCRKSCLAYAVFEGPRTWKIRSTICGHAAWKLGRLRARSFWPFLPAPRRTGRDTCRIIRLSGFLVSLTWASWHGCHHDSVCRAACFCVFGISVTFRIIFRIFKVICREPF
jgi:hypothetical protein